MEHTLILLLWIFYTQAFAAVNENEKEEFCTNLSCENNLKINVCGIRQEGEGVRLKLFESECELLKFGCQVDRKHAYGLIDMEYCEKSLGHSEEIDDEGPELYKINNGNNNRCFEYDCNNPSHDTGVCGVRPDGDGFRVKLFPNKCELLKNNCEENLNFTQTDTFICKGFQNVENSNEIFEEDEIIMTDTTQTTTDDTLMVDNTQTPTDETIMIDNTQTSTDETIMIDNTQTSTDETIIIDNTQTSTDETIMIDNTQTSTDETIMIDNTQTPTDETITIDNTQTSSDTTIMIDTTQTPTKETITILSQKLDTSQPKNLVIIDNSILNYNGNINETMDKFFASTHVRALPVMSLDPLLNETTRRRLIKIAGPVKVFKPWIVIPKNISDNAEEDRMLEPTLSSCFHKCPTKCPDTYAPVCGVPGIQAREPSLMFKNHCFMDVAQCKMRWENVGSTAESSAYIESSFMVCLGEELNSLYRFLPLVRSLQRMGRLKQKGYFRYKIRNMKFFNQFLAQEPKIMG